MTVILGIDAAWTNTEPSGVALIALKGNAWSPLAVAPSYQSFIGLSDGVDVDWSIGHRGNPPDATSLLTAASKLAGAPVDIVAIDMPISRIPFTKRRPADDAISQEFGARWCSAHSPGVARPGTLGATLSTNISLLGYPIATVSTPQGSFPALVEVYPHPALLGLLNRPMRVPYKVSKSSRYWPGKPVDHRIGLLLAEFQAIRDGLREVFGPLPFDLPTPGTITQLSHLKKYEDALDALVCGWIGTLYASGEATPLGDADAAIWCPTKVVLSML